MSFFSIGILLGMIISASIYLKRKGIQKSDIFYLLYAKTSFGRYYHQKNLRGGGNGMASSSHYEDSNCYVRIIPFLSDNYAYLVTCKKTLKTCIVDPADPELCLKAFNEEKQFLGKELHLASILTTHYHHDHAGGNKEISSSFPSIQIVGGPENYPGVDQCTHEVKDGEEFLIGEMKVKVLHVPCHTYGSVMYVINNLLCFSGDFLFSAGCGRFFEGGAQDFCSSIEKNVVPLPDSTLLFPGHEYTLSNLKFGMRLLPNNENLQSHLQWAKEKRDSNLPTIPIDFGVERKINLFIQAADRNLLNKELLDAVRGAIVKNPNLSVTSGADKRDLKTRIVQVTDGVDDPVEIVRVHYVL